jgi:hypothetical protein
MTRVVPQSVEDLVVALDYGQFSLSTGVELDSMDILNEAIEGRGIAQRRGTTVVLSRHQNNFAMPLRVEVWPAPPIDDLDEWEMACDVHIEVGESGLVYQSPTMYATELPVPPGSYRLRICARGFIAYGFPGTTTPPDVWRLQCWPDDSPNKPQILRGFPSRESEVTADDTPDVLAEAVRRAAKRINADLGQHDGSMRLFPLDGTATARCWIPADSATVRERFIDVAARTTAIVEPPASEPSVERLLRNNDPERADPPFDGLPTGPTTEGDPRPGLTLFQLRTFVVPTVHPEPARLAVNWQRLTFTEDGSRTLTDILPIGTMVEATFTAESRDSVDGTLATVVHTRLPRRWTEDFSTIWAWNLTMLR